MGTNGLGELMFKMLNDMCILMCYKQIVFFSFLLGNMAVVEDLLCPVSPLPEEVEEFLLREAALKSIFNKKDEIIKQINPLKISFKVVLHTSTKII